MPSLENAHLCSPLSLSWSGWSRRPGDREMTRRLDGVICVAPTLLEQTFRWVSILLGCSLLWLSLFTRPDEQRRYQSRFVDWWVRIEALREEGLSRLTAFLVTILGKSDQIFTSLMGPHLISWRAIGASLALADSGFYVFAGVGLMVSTTREPNYLVFLVKGSLPLLFFGVLFFALGLVQVRAPRWWPLEFSFALLGAAPIVFIFTTYCEEKGCIGPAMLAIRTKAQKRRRGHHPPIPSHWSP